MEHGEGGRRKEKNVGVEDGKEGWRRRKKMKDRRTRMKLEVDWEGRGWRKKGMEVGEDGGARRWKRRG